MTYDLTTQEGRKNAIKFFDKYGWAINIYVWGIRKIFKTHEDTIKSQTKMTKELIKTGKDNGVDEMEITVDNQVGLNIGAEIEGMPISAKIGSNGKTTLKIKYK